MIDFRIAALVSIAIVATIFFVWFRFLSRSVTVESTLSLCGYSLGIAAIFVTLIFFFMLLMSTDVPVGEPQTKATSYRLVKIHSGEDGDCYLSRTGRNGIRYSYLEEDGSLADNSVPCGDMIICYTDESPHAVVTKTKQKCDVRFLLIYFFTCEVATTRYEFYIPEDSSIA